ncbi:MAG: PASTA domain-containing protein [Bacteroidota bacterium]
MRGILRFLTSGKVWMNVLLIGVFVVLVIFLTVQWLGLYTLHGETITVPDIRGMTIAEIEDLLVNSDMTYQITDSLYSDEFPRGTVVTQNPRDGKEVKQGRTIYLTINSYLPEMVAVPDLIGKSKRIAIPILEITGLRLNSLKYRPDESCTDCVVGLEYKGEEVEPGELLMKDVGVNLILGQNSDVPTSTPDLLGLTYTEAYELIIASSLNMGSVLYCEGCENKNDSSDAFVMNQRPKRNEMINLGSFIDLYLTTDTSRLSIIESPKDTIINEN